MSNVNISKKIGKGYKRFWNFKGRYTCVKGGRGSKKSTTASMWIIYNTMKYPLANTLIIRKTFNTHLNSTFTQLKWAANNLEVSHLWKFSKSPLEATYLPTGQKVLFRGLDDPMSITSITVEKGFLCWCWFEEAYQVINEDDFNKIDMSIRGALPDTYFKRIMLTFNPWNNKHWLNKRFFTESSSDTLALTTNYLCNEWLGEDDIRIFEDMKIRHPKRYQIEGLGDWGISEGLVFENWEESDFNVDEIRKQDIQFIFGLDWGFTDPTTLICAMVNTYSKELYIFDEEYRTGLTNIQISDLIKYKGYSKEKIICDSAEPKSIVDLKNMGIRKAMPAAKGKDSIINGIRHLQEYKIFIKPSCTHTIIEFENYTWQEGKIDKPIDDFCHLIDSLRYAMEPIKDKNKSITISKKGWGI